MGVKVFRLAVAVAAAAAVWIPGAAQSAAAPARATVSNCVPGATWGTPKPDLATQALDLINQHRAGMGLGTLKTSPTLTASALWKSMHMSEYQYFGHDDPAPPVARSAFQRIADCG